MIYFTRNIKFKDEILLFNDFPVWPVLDDKEEYSLRNLANVFEGKLQFVEEGFVKKRSKIIQDRGIVIAWKDCSTIAKLYAHLTFREFIITNDPIRAFKGYNSAVILGLQSDLSYEILDAFYDPLNNGGNVGFIYSHNLAGLRRQALLKSATLYWNNIASIDRIDWYPDIKTLFPQNSFHSVIGYSTPKDTIKKTLEKPPAILNIFAHSDGLDMKLSPFTLCPIKSLSPLGDNAPSNPPFCVVNSYCYRLNQKMENALKNDLLLSPEKLKARILILNSCFGIRFSPNRINPSWQIAIQLMNSTYLGAIVITWKIIQTNPDLIEPLITEILKGQTIGQSVAQFNLSENALKYDIQFGILGDPECKLPSTPRIYLSMANKKKKTLFREREFSALNFLNLYFNFSIYHHKGKLKTLAKKIVAEIGKYQLDLFARSNNKPIELNYLISEFFRQNYFELVNLFSSPDNWEPSKVSCPNCGCPATRWRYQMDSKTLPTRIVINCPNCMVNKDTSEYLKEADFSYDEEKSAFLIHWPTIQHSWDGLLKAEYKMRSVARYWEIKGDRSIFPQNEVLVDTQGMMEGELYLACVLIIDFEIAIVRKPARVNKDGKLKIIDRLN
ncbi:hypothetical protein EXU57_24595 [Segetibacter sp. 3557_3]|uniref:hypothetical protein n=1 Tax=Segetibacter sp. 3557_3 TaxID=2547429 RepID=UPI001058B368|nr:hypothetical protein [Segetibacter sp. 3557_3]TDH18055.1 hypothetical protein EXU57_24595 [Segetibacter sp. 3557_3]